LGLARLHLFPEEAVEEQIVEPINNEEQPVDGYAQQIDADNVMFSDGLVGLVNARMDMTMHDSAALTIGVGRDMDITDAGAVFLSVGGNSEINDGGAMVMVANKVNAQNSFLGVVVGDTTLEEGSTMLLDSKRAVMFGAAFGAVVGFFLWLLRKR
jgi:hypothetical protein